MAQTSISTTFDYSVPLSEQLPMIRKAGFTHVSFGMDYTHSGLLDEKSWDGLRKLLQENDLLVDTVHGYDLDREDSLEKNEILARAAKALGAPVVVIHCTVFWFEDDEYDEKFRVVSGRIKEMERIAKETGIRLLSQKKSSSSSAILRIFPTRNLLLIKCFSKEDRTASTRRYRQELPLSRILTTHVCRPLMKEKRSSTKSSVFRSSRPPRSVPSRRPLM